MTNSHRFDRSRTPEAANVGRATARQTDSLLPGSTLPGFAAAAIAAAVFLFMPAPAREAEAR